ncbi:MAG: molybdopterin biosynthesis protein MoeA, partial [Synergistales bacterium]|nr:molybdopterin biosynthesis protein MoeA [Synergistales bacterium]
MALVKENMHVTLARAWEILEENCSSLSFESCPVQETFGRILAGDVVSRRNVPHYNASAMDGYALCSRMTAGASQSTPLSFAPEDAVWVNTGGDLPPQFDCVAMVEDTSTDRETGIVVLAKSLVAGENVRPLGEDVFCGQVIAREGDTVSPALASLLATAGVSEVDVLAVPKTLYIPTGDEIIPMEEWLSMDLPPSG